MTLPAGTSLGPYQVLAPIGAGGMGEVYRARDPRLGREVAVKVLPASVSEEPDRLRRFAQEARAASALNHPNILAVYDVGTHDGTHYVVSELLEGETLAARIAEGPLPLRKALGYAFQVATGLAVAHGKGIVHRDLKPANLFVTHDGRVKILDFGVAKLARPERQVGADEEATVSTPPATTPGALIGTAGYMAPEQLRGLAADHRSDIFSFGAILYEMLFGRRAFKGDTWPETMYAILKLDPLELPGTERVLPPSVERILRHCLEKSPDERFQSARDLAFHLEAISASSEAAAPRKPFQALSWRRWAWAAALPALLAAGFFGWQAWRASQRAEPLRAVSLTTLPGTERYPSFSPDGNHVAFTWTGSKQDNPDIYVQMIGSGSPLRLTTDPRSDLNPAWSPDGRWIAFFRGEPLGPLSQSTLELRLIPPLGGPERKLAEVRAQEFSERPVYLAWSPDSNALVVTDSTGTGKPDALFVVSLETGEKRQLTHPKPPVIADTSPAVSPDGRSLVFRRSAAWDSGELYLLPLGEGLTARGEPTRLTLPSLSADYPAWMPEGKDILFSARGSLWRLAIPGEDQPARLPFVGEDGLMPVISRPQPGRPARLVYVRRFTDENVWRIETTARGAPSSSAPVVSISSTRSDIHPKFSPDGRRVAFTSTRSGDWEIWLADPDGSNAIQLTSLGARATGAPHWSPDGQVIAFASNLEGEFEIYRIPASGGKPRNLTSHPAFDHSPSFSSDGKWIYFSSTRTGTYELWKIPASGGDAVRVTTNGGFANAEAPDGAFLYHTQTADTPTALWRLPTSGGQAVKVLDGIVWWSFCVLEKGIYYVDQPTGEARLQFLDFATRRSTTVARSLGHIDAGLTTTPDGRTILYSRVDSSVEDLMLVENFR